MSLALALGLLLAGAVGPVAVPVPIAAPAPTSFYPASADAHVAVAAVLADAARSGRPAVLVFGADWCHDSRALAKALTSPAFHDEFGTRFSVTFIDVATPQTGAGRNLDLAERLGIKRLHSTPALVVVAANGKPLNSAKDAVGWRNADSRGEGAILAWFRTLKTST